MQLQFLLLITSIFTILFLVLWIKTFKGQSLKALWKKAKQITYYKQKLKKEQQKAEKEGLKPFHFDAKLRPATPDNFTYEVYAKSQLGAIGKLKAAQNGKG